MVADRLADRVDAGALGERRAGCRRRGHPARVPRRVGQLRAGRCEGRARGRARTASTTRRRPSGGNVYDRRLSTASPRRAGRSTCTRWLVLAGGRTRPRDAARPRARRMPDDAVVLVDGLVASAVPDVLVPGGAPAAGRRTRAHAARRTRRRRGRDPSRAGRCAAPAAVVDDERLDAATGCSSSYALAPRAGPRRRARASTRAGLARGTPPGRQLLCVAAVTRDKGHDVLLAALASVVDLPWTLHLRRQPGPSTRRFADGLRRLARAVGIGDRVRPRRDRSTGPTLDTRVRRGRPAGAAIPSGELRHGRDRGARPRAAGDRDRGRWCARGARHPTGGATARACSCRPTTRSPSPTPCGAGSTTPSCAHRCARPPERRRDADRLVGDRRPRSARVLAEVAPVSRRGPGHGCACRRRVRSSPSLVWRLGTGPFLHGVRDGRRAGRSSRPP